MIYELEGEFFMLDDILFVSKVKHGLFKCSFTIGFKQGICLKVTDHRMLIERYQKELISAWKVSKHPK